MDDFNWYAHEKEPKNKNSVPLCNLNNLQLRFLCPEDVEEVRNLCEKMFPIWYPSCWYWEITSNPKIYSLAAVYNGTIVGIIVAEIKSYNRLNIEDYELLSRRFRSKCTAGYLLTLGVAEEYRRHGIASLLLDNLVSHVTAPENQSCKAIFLHVLTTNTPAIHFYEHRNFRLHSFLPYYYSIQGKCKDGFTYVLYVNGGHPPWSLYDYVKHYGKMLLQGDLCRCNWLIPKKLATGFNTNLVKWLARVCLNSASWLSSRLRWAVCWVWPGMRRLVVENSTSLITHYS